MLMPGGLFVVIGAGSGNKKELYNLFEEQQLYPKNILSSEQFYQKIYMYLKLYFNKVSLFTYKNLLCFYDLSNFMKYYDATTSKQRGLWDYI